MGTLMISQQSFREESMKMFCIDSVQNVPIRLGVKLDYFSEDGETEDCPFRE